MQRLKEPFGKAGLILAVVALVIRAVGGAYAPTPKPPPQQGGNAGVALAKKSYSKVFSKRSVRSASPSGFAWTAGPAGPQGPRRRQGRQRGTRAADGTDGSNGSNGGNGKSCHGSK